MLKLLHLHEKLFYLWWVQAKRFFRQKIHVLYISYEKFIIDAGFIDLNKTSKI